MYYPASLAALSALVVLSTASPNGWSSVKSAPDGPNKLDECGCGLIYQTMLTCQKLKGPNSGVRDCACIPNPDGWYGWMNNCRACLSPGSLDNDDFFDNLSRTISQLFVSCTEAGGGIQSDGESICASNYYFEACTSLKGDGQLSWASYEVFAEGEKGNGTYVLDLAESQGSSSATDTATPKTTATSSVTTAADSSTTVTTTSSVVDATGTETTSAASETTSPSSAMGYAGTRSQTGRIMGLGLAVGVAVIVL
ncbi:uncharacterized protein B0H64DRAFT_405495 [Chaetomium fimeti]|uniref:Uncharacterized protein n=1 Tax=Chaetomium fimeti TaxID=1854472 RepID=A0AAE0LPD3_9PEZI|nr:hypothetical protein B0H64DRAFT_405495 [Chaetomium fimeti]